MVVSTARGAGITSERLPLGSAAGQTTARAWRQAHKRRGPPSVEGPSGSDSAASPHSSSARCRRHRGRASPWNLAAASSIARHCGSAVDLLDLLADLLVQGGDPRRPGGVGRLALGRAEPPPVPCSRGCYPGRRAALLAALLVVLPVVVIWTLPVPEPTPVREGLRNGCRTTHSPDPSGTELCSGAGSDGGGRPGQDCFRSAAPEGRKDLGPVGRRRRGRPLR
jgi:hypothetical protein